MFSFGESREQVIWDLLIKRKSITNTVPSAGSLAIVNGAAASFSCLARSIGPLTTGPLFDWSNRRDFAVLPFWITSGVSAAAAIEAWVLNDHP